jgi:CRP-like cAMP-binding protein
MSECPFLDIPGRSRSFEMDHVFGLPDDIIHHVYAVQSGLVSVVVHLENGKQVETAMVGPGGLVGASALAGANWTNVFVAQSTITAWEMDARTFRFALRKRSGLCDLAFRHVQWLMAQAQQTVACSSTHPLEERLASWLLRVNDLTGWTDIPFTQEVISKLLGVRRPSVSLVITALKEESLIGHTRARINILDKTGLEKYACECYRTLCKRRNEIFNQSSDMQSPSYSGSRTAHSTAACGPDLRP